MAITKVSGELVDLNESTSESGLKIPTGNNTNRPATDVAGMVRNNTNETSDSSASCEEYYNGAAWKKINNVALPPEKVFQTINWTGTAAEQTITYANSPDLVLIKNYDTSSNSDPWYWFDSTRGATKYIQSASNAAEATDAQTLKSFTSTGFVLGTNDAVNGNGHNTYGFGFRVNGGVTSSNTDGSTTSTVQANNQTGISIVKYTGTGANASVGHGLAVAPTLIIIKKLNSTSDWVGGALDWTKYLEPNGTPDFRTANVWQNTAPTDSVFTLTTGGDSNGGGNEYIAYCFSDIANYSKVGSYNGTGSQGSPSVNVGFKPDLLIVKRITGGPEQWWVGNSATNSSDHWTNWMPLQSNERLQSDTIHSITVTSNGFEPYGTSALVNASGSSYLYLAFKINS
jgi:hypothetical protein